MTRLVVSVISIILIVLIAVFSIVITKSMINDTVNEIENLVFDENYYGRCLLVEKNWQKRIKFIRCFMNHTSLIEANKAIGSIKFSTDIKEFFANCQKAKEELYIIMENEKTGLNNILII